MTVLVCFYCLLIAFSAGIVPQNCYLKMPVILLSSSVTFLNIAVTIWSF